MVWHAAVTIVLGHWSTSPMNDEPVLGAVLQRQSQVPSGSLTGHLGLLLGWADPSTSGAGPQLSDI